MKKTKVRGISNYAELKVSREGKRENMWPNVQEKVIIILPYNLENNFLGL
jgi:hypothetical protein